MNPDEQKKMVAVEASHLVKDGTVIGIGTGSTVKYFIDELGKLVRSGMKLKGVPTSVDTAIRARQVGIEIDEHYSGIIDLDVDGADEIDPQGNLIKGGGGALLRE